jgi:hypothetical protein
MLLPSKVTEPSVTLYTPVIRLKMVVLPAPLGPISPTMPPSRTLKSHVRHRGQTAEALGEVLYLEDIGTVSFTVRSLGGGLFGLALGDDLPYAVRRKFHAAHEAAGLLIMMRMTAAP